MKRLFWGFALLTFSLGGAFTAKANPVTDMVEGATNPANYFIFGQVKTYYELVDKIDSLRIELNLLAKDIATQTASIEALAAEKIDLTNQIEALEEKQAALQRAPDPTEEIDNELNEIQTQIQTLETELVQTETDLEILSQELEETLLPAKNQFEQQIETLEEELSKSQIKIRGYAEGLVKKIVIALAIWFIAVITKAILTFVFNRLDFYITPQRKAFVLQLIRLGVNTIAFIGILLVFFSQLLQALPYFAILATALAFALRDVILSVIAWLIIGTKDGYKVGHYLHIGDLWGTVEEVNPFNTIVRQGGMSGQTGRLLTFPNKKIFDTFLENWSKLHNFTFLKWDFFLEQGSDIERAEEILLEIMAKEQAQFKERIEAHRHLFLKKGLEVDDLTPRIFWEIQANGILLRGKLLVDFDDFFEIRSNVTRAFAMAIAQDENIQLRFVNNLIPNEF